MRALRKALDAIISDFGSMAKAMLSNAADPRRFTDKHDREQWEKLQTLPNLIYTDGNAFSLWRNGDLEGSVIALDGDIETAGAKLTAPSSLSGLFSDFFQWQPQPPKSALSLAELTARLCRLLREEVTVIKKTDKKHMQKEVRARIETGSELHTDEHGGYRGMDDEYTHKVIRHAADEYVRGHVTTNRIENFWTLLKRTIKGSYVSVEPFHLHRYLDEQAFRFNERGGKDSDRFVHVASSVAGKRLTYKELTGNQKLLSSPAQ